MVKRIFLFYGRKVLGDYPKERKKGVFAVFEKILQKSKVETFKSLEGEPFSKFFYTKIKSLVDNLGILSLRIKKNKSFGL